MITCALNVFVSAISVVPNALLTHRLDMRDIAVGTFVGGLFGAFVAVAMSYMGFGVWALAMPASRWLDRDDRPPVHARALASA